MSELYAIVGINDDNRDRLVSAVRASYSGDISRLISQIGLCSNVVVQDRNGLWLHYSAESLVYNVRHCRTDYPHATRLTVDQFIERWGNG